MFSNSNAYHAEVQHRRRQLREDLARRQRAKQVKLARRNRNR
jgi:hypothetical protein